MAVSRNKRHLTIFFNHNYLDYLLNVSTAIDSFHREFWDGYLWLKTISIRNTNIPIWRYCTRGTGTKNATYIMYNKSSVI